MLDDLTEARTVRVFCPVFTFTGHRFNGLAFGPLYFRSRIPFLFPRKKDEMSQTQQNAVHNLTRKAQTRSACARLPSCVPPSSWKTPALTFLRCQESRFTWFAPISTLRNAGTPVLRRVLRSRRDSARVSRERALLKRKLPSKRCRLEYDALKWFYVWYLYYLYLVTD